jgi:hypothetical protein
MVIALRLFLEAMLSVRLKKLVFAVSCSQVIQVSAPADEQTVPLNIQVIGAIHSLVNVITMHQLCS